MGNQRVLATTNPTGDFRDVGAAAMLHGCLPGRAECLQQLLLAYLDIVDRDDIHRAAERLVQVQRWIRDEAARASSDPVFAELCAV